MTAGFDLYHKWLGIPPQEQPPNHYRLLGVALLEGDPDVIQNAADQRMRHVRSFQNGPHAADSQRLLNEIAAARLCLLNPAQKPAYDASLSAPPPLRPRSAVPPAAPPLAAPPPTRPAPRAEPAEMASALPVFVTPPLRKPASETRRVPVAALGAAAVAVLAVAVAATCIVQFFIGWGLARSERRATERNVVQSRPQPRPQPNRQTAKTPVPVVKPAETTVSTNTVVPPNKGEPGKVTQHVWERGQARISMGPRNESFATLSWVAGHFLGNGEWFTIDVDNEQRWRLSGNGLKQIGCAAIEFQTPQRAWFEDQVEQREWVRGQPPLKLIHQHDGFAVLSGVTGCFLDHQQGVRVRLESDGFWYLSGHTNVDTKGRAHVYRFKLPGKFRAQVQQHDWQPGVAKARLLAQEEGVCFLSGMSGGFHGYGESLRCEVEQDGHWHFGGDAKQASMRGSAISIKFPTIAEFEVAQRELPTPRVEPAPPVAPPPPVVVTTRPRPRPAPRIIPRQTSPSETPQKLTPPDDETVAKASATVADLYKKDFADAKTPPKRVELFKKLLSDGQQTSDDLAGKFALLKAARKLATQSGDFELAMQAVEATNTAFEVNRSELIAEVIPEIAGAARQPDQHFEVARNIEYVLPSLLKAGDYRPAADLAELGVSAARKSRDTELVKDWVRRQEEVQSQSLALAAVDAHIQTLKSNPTDPAANTAVGRFRAFVQQDWQAAIPLLSRGDDKPLATLAQTELKENLDAAAQADLGRAWFEWGQSQDPQIKRAAWQRAARWLRGASPGVEGLAKVRLDNQLTEIDAATSPFREGVWVEVLDAVDVAKHRIDGEWRRYGVLVATDERGGKHLALPVHVDGSYEVRIRAMRVMRNLSLVCPDDAHPFRVSFNGWDGKFSSVEKINGLDGANNKNPSRVPAFPPEPDKLTTLTLRVERKEGAVNIELRVSGRKHMSWRGPEAALSVDAPDTRRLGIGTHNAAVLLLSAQVRVLKGTARFVD